MSDNLKKDIRKASTANSLMIFLFIALILGVRFLISFIFSKLPDSSSFNINMIQTLVLYIFQYAFIVPLLLILFHKTKYGKTTPKLKECFCKTHMPASQLIKWIFILLFFIYLSSYISTFLFTIIENISDTPLHPATVNTDTSLLNRFTNIIALMFLAPIFEEMFFRGTLLRNSARYGSWAMIISMGIMFGLWHVNYVQTLPTAMLGICAGFLIVKSGSIIPSLILHFIMNTIGTAQSFVSGKVDAVKLSSGDIDYIMENIISIIVSIFIGFLLICIMITGLVLLIIELAKHHLNGFKLPCEYTGISEQKKFAIYFSSPITIAVTIALLGFTIYNAFTL